VRKRIHLVVGDRRKRSLFLIQIKNRPVKVGETVIRDRSGGSILAAGRF